MSAKIVRPSVLNDCVENGWVVPRSSFAASAAVRSFFQLRPDSKNASMNLTSRRSRKLKENTPSIGGKSAAQTAGDRLASLPPLYRYPRAHRRIRDADTPDRKSVV